MKPLVVGLVGRHGTGKSSLASRLRDRLLPNAYVISFADAIREKLQSALPRVLMKTKRHPYEREALVFIGEEWRAVDPEHWIKAWRRRVRKATAGCGNCIRPVIIVDDVYHWNEQRECDLIVSFVAETPLPMGYIPISVRETEEMLMSPPYGLVFEHPMAEHVEDRILEEIERLRNKS